MYRYLIGGTVGVASAATSLRVSRMGGTYGGETNAFHDFSDGILFYISAVLEWLKQKFTSYARVLDDVGLWMNSLSFIGVGVWMIYRALSEVHPPLFNLYMLAAGAVALVGNALQFFALGEASSEDEHMHHTNLGHVALDALNSLFVVIGSGIVELMSSNLPPSAKALMASMMCFAPALLITKFLDVEEWWGWYVSLALLLSGAVGAIAAYGNAHQIDMVLTIGLSLGMILGGCFYLYKRYFKKSVSATCGHSHGHHHGHYHH